MDKESEDFLDEELPASAAADASRLLNRFRAGERDAAAELFNRYVARLVGLASSRLSRGMRRRVDPEDVVQSAYRSFFVHAAEGDYQIGESADLWRLLARITLNKVRKQAERHTAARRDFRRDDGLSDAGTAVAVKPTPIEAAALVEQFGLVVERLSADERLALAAHLQGDQLDEIARRLGKSPRTVRRALARARSLAEHQLLESTAFPTHFVGESPPENQLPYSDYRLERLIGAGGMGKVYRATQISTGAVVAIKAIRKDRQKDPRAVKQLVHEAAVVGGPRHPGIIRVHGLGRFPAGGYFLVMDHVEGYNLQTLVDQRRVRPDDAVSVIERVAEAIGHAHAAGVVHCDLKPANVLVSANGAVVVTDFGFAQLISKGSPRTLLGGTLGYLAPELLKGLRSPSPAADVFSLGRMLQRIVALDEARLQRVSEHCLAENAADRPQSIAEFLRLLRAAESTDD